jgi:hypothetical protein
LVEAAATKAIGQGKVAVVVEGPIGARANVIRVTTTPGWNLAPGLGPAVVLPSDWDPAYSAPQVLSALGRAKDGSWSSVPILYDVWGQTTFAGKGAMPPPPGEWRDLLKRAEPESLSVAGGRPSFRQAAFLFELFPDVPAAKEAASWFNQGPDRWEAPGAVLPALVKDRSWPHDAWSFTRNDQIAWYKQGKRLVFLETYRDYESIDPPGVRRFVPLVAAKEGAGHSMAGEVLFMEYRGRAADLARALKLMRVLAGDEFQKQAGMTGKWLAASRTAPEIDGIGAAARNRVAGAARFFPVADGLPDPLVEGSVWTDVQLAVERAPKR